MFAACAQDFGAAGAIIPGDSQAWIVLLGKCSARCHAPSCECRLPRRGSAANDPRHLALYSTALKFSPLVVPVGAIFEGLPCTTRARLRTK